ncbi:MAG: Na/Pi cotransporter family protein [Candidatus Dadabacteria bacterium]|nr:MAG: Na/Pi cotransporter family protein [Candidatus Dadabacteria bacterium]
MSERVRRVLGVLAVLGLLYLFLVSIGMVGAAFKLAGKGFAKEIFGFASNPLTGLFIGIFATSLVQSSSTTTSIVVGLVAGGMPVETAIPIIMGANIGTSVTNTLVSLGHISRTNEFERAFAASTVHDFFNLLSVLVLFPLQYFTGFLGHLAHGLAGVVTGGADLHFHSPLKAVVKPAVKLFVHGAGGITDAKLLQAALIVVLAGVLLFVSLKYMSAILRGMVMDRAAGFFERTIFRNAPTAFVVGILLTIAVQSSSITTSVIVPLAGAGLLTLEQVYPYTLGANIGTTITAILASLAVQEHFTAAVTAAFSHLLFNVCGIVALNVLPPVRRIPLRLARTLAGQAVRRKWVPLLYILVVFFLIPLALIFATR